MVNISDVLLGILLLQNQLVMELVQSHDTQPGQTLTIPIEEFFKLLVYAFILFCLDGYTAVFTEICKASRDRMS